MLHLSAGQWIFYGLLSIVWAFLGYRLSENDRKMLGRTPWGLPSMVWAFFWFLSLILGLVLYLIAHSTGVRHAQRNPEALGGPRGANLASPSVASSSSAGQTRPTAADLFPAYPRPANARPTDASDLVHDPEVASDQPRQAQSTEEGTSAQGQVSPPAWHPDPSGRFHYRWWDGAEWTAQVSTDGHHLIDTNPDQRIGPY